MDETAEYVLSDDSCLAADRLRCRWPFGWSLADGSVGSMTVVVGEVLLEHGVEVLGTKYEHTIQALAQEAAHDSFADGVRVGACTGVRMISIPSEVNTSRNWR